MVNAALKARIGGRANSFVRAGGRTASPALRPSSLSVPSRLAEFGDLADLRIDAQQMINRHLAPDVIDELCKGMIVPRQASL